MEPSEGPTLMQKWKMHYHNRDFKPKERDTFRAVDRYTLLFCLVFTPSLLITALNISIPGITNYAYIPGHEDSRRRLIFKIIVWFSFIQVLVNWILTVSRSKRSIVTRETKDDANKPRLEELPESLGIQEDWTVCTKCQHYAPPRSHHCDYCQVCVMKRVHHCYFTSTCIGFHGQRYFMVFLFYAAVGSIACVILNLSYTGREIKFWSSEVYSYLPIFTIWKYFMGKMKFVHFFLIIQSWLALMTFVLATVFFFWDMLMIFRGQTSYEAWKNIHRYRVEPMHNIRSVFGSYWMLNFIFPMPTTQDGDGIHWDLHKRVKGN